MNRPDHVVAQAVGQIGIMLVECELVGQLVVLAQTASVGTKPQHAGSVLVNRPHSIAAQAVQVVRIVPIACELIPITIEQVEPVLSPDPQPSGPVLQNRPHSVVAQAARIIGVVLMMDESP